MSQSGKTDITDHPDAVRRIVDSQVSDDSTTVEEVLNDLRSVSDGRVTREHAQSISNSIVTEERIIQAIEASGELPTAGELNAITSAVDEFGMGDRQSDVLNSVSDRVATTEDFEAAIERDRPLTRADAEAMVSGMDKEIRGADPQDLADDIVTVEDVVQSPDTDPRRSSEPVFREDVESTTRDMSAGSGLADSSDRVDEVAREASREIGAPSESAYKRAQIQAVSETVTPANEPDVANDSSTPVNVVRDESGDVAGVYGSSAEPIEETAAVAANAGNPD